MTAEQLYLALSIIDDVESELEELLLGLSWIDDGVGASEAAQVTALMCS